MHIVWFLLVGLLAGWLASRIMKGPELSLPGNLVLGVVGALIGGFLLNLLGMTATGTLGSVVTATLGAIVLIFCVGALRRR
jgi:uncharacterized membrane protein YeaQ/YmgE (transglycosylase-associated protein family)